MNRLAILLVLVSSALIGCDESATSTNSHILGKTGSIATHGIDWDSVGGLHNAMLSSAISGFGSWGANNSWTEQRFEIARYCINFSSNDSITWADTTWMYPHLNAVDALYTSLGLKAHEYSRVLDSLQSSYGMSSTARSFVSRMLGALNTVYNDDSLEPQDFADSCDAIATDLIAAGLNTAQTGCVMGTLAVAKASAAHWDPIVNMVEIKSGAQVQGKKKSPKWVNVVGADALGACIGGFTGLFGGLIGGAVVGSVLPGAGTAVGAAGGALGGLITGAISGGGGASIYEAVKPS